MDRNNGRSNRNRTATGGTNHNRRTTAAKPKLFNSKMQASLLLVFCVVLLLFIGLAVRVAMVNAENSDRYKKRVYSQQTYVSAAIPYKRGDITDRNGTILATSVRTYKLIIDPLTILSEERYRQPTIQALTQCFDVTAEEIEAVLKEKPESQYYILAKKVEYEAKEAFEALDEEDNKKKSTEQVIAGVWFEEMYERQYPQNSLACDVIGFTYSENQGNWGLEEYYNDQLNGTNGRSYGYYDSELNLQRTVKNAVDGNTVVSTIDANVQAIVEKYIQEFNEETGSENCAAIVMNPNTGEIYAMASAPFYDLNNPRDLTGIYSEKELDAMTDEEYVEALSALWRNYCISDSYEPGSTFKPLVVAAGLEEGLLQGNESYTCKGYADVAGTKIGCAKKTGHGKISLAETIAYSCNASLMQIGEKIGRANMYNYISKFNFGRRTGIDLPGEGTGITFSKEQLNPTELATTSFGQGFTVTMVQLAAAMSSAINGGNYYEPYMVKEIRNAAGVVIEEKEPVLVKRTVSARTSEKIREYMALAVKSGTAVSAQVDGFEIAGKTGTAEKYPRDKKNYLVSFVGFSPIENPEVLIYVIIDQPHVEKQSDSSYATKLSAKIMEEILPFLGVYSSKEPVKDNDKDQTADSQDKKKDDSSKDDTVVNKPGTDELDWDDVLGDNVGSGVVGEEEPAVPEVDRNESDQEPSGGTE